MASYIVRKAFTREVSDAAIEHMSIRELMSLHHSRRSLHWLRRMLRWAVALELSTIPLYLYARWSVAILNEVTDWMAVITRQEMAHMATALNVLHGIGGTCSVMRAAPRFPRHGLPGGVRPDLRLSLKPLSKRLVRRMFMEIEKPEFGDYQVYAGQTYPTIGAFYAAICDALRHSGLSDLDTTHQLEYIDPTNAVIVRMAPNVTEAITEIGRIVSEGEGTSASPETEPGSGVLSHYWSFSQIDIGQKLVFDGQGWSYSGGDVDFPAADQIRQISPALPRECDESIAFDSKYTQVLDSLQRAWDTGGTEGRTHLTNATSDMGELFSLAFDLMNRPAQGRPLGPGFHIAF